MQMPLLLQLIGQASVTVPGNGVRTAEGQVAGEQATGFPSLLQALWRTGDEVSLLAEGGSEEALQLQEVLSALSSDLPVGLQPTPGAEGVDLAALLEALNVASRGDGEVAAIAQRLLERLRDQVPDAEQLLHAVQDLLELPEVAGDAPPDQLLLELLAQLPEPQREELVRWVDSGNALPEAASRLDGLLQRAVAAGDAQVEDLAQAIATARPPGSAGNRGTNVVGGEGVAGQPAPKATPDSLPLVPEKAETPPETSPVRTERALQPLQPLQPQPPVDAAGQRPATAVSTLAPGAEQAAGVRGTLAELNQSLAPLQVPQGQREWGNALGERVLWMVGREMQRAELRLNPPQLGPVEIRVAVQNDQASVSFSAAHPLTREALEGAIPRLREMLAENNLDLANVDVGQHDTGESRREGASHGAGAPGYTGSWEGDPGGEPLAAAAVAARIRSGLVDDFA